MIKYRFFVSCLLVLIANLVFAQSLDKGKNAFMSNKPQEAITWFELALKENPSNSDLFIWLAVSHEQAGNPEKAYTVLNTALTSSVGEPKVILYNMGNTLARQGKYQEAVEHYTKSLGFDSAFSMAYQNRANALVHQKKLVEAREDYVKTLETSKNNPQESQIIAMIKAIDDELAAIKKAIEEDSKAKEQEEARKQALAAEQSKLDELKKQAEYEKQQEALQAQIREEEKKKAEEERRRKLFNSVLSGLEGAADDKIQLDGGVEKVKENEDLIGREE